MNRPVLGQKRNGTAQKTVALEQVNGQSGKCNVCDGLTEIKLEDYIRAHFFCLCLFVCLSSARLYKIESVDRADSDGRQTVSQPLVIAR